MPADLCGELCTKISSADAISESVRSAPRMQPSDVTGNGPDRAAVNILGVKISPVNLDEAVEILEGWRESGHRDYVCCVSAHGLVTAQRNTAIRKALNGAGLATKDGMPLVWWCKYAGYRDSLRVCGSDLLDAMCALGAKHKHRHYFYGGNPQVVERLVRNLIIRHPGLVIAGYHSPPFRTLTAVEVAEDIEAINEAAPDFVWIGLGMPKQEAWMAQHLGKINAAALIGVGAAFDFHAGVKGRAPRWMQRSGLEWLFRLASEPRRLARRYLVDNSVFLAHAFAQLTGLRSYVIEQHRNGA